MAVLEAIVSLYRAGEEKPIERYNTRVKVVEENKLKLYISLKMYTHTVSSQICLRTFSMFYNNRIKYLTSENNSN